MSRRTNLKTFLLISVFLLATGATATGKIIFVDANAPGANNGLSWTNAYNYLQDGLVDANSEAKPVEIRVAQGIYKPDQSSADPNGTGDRTATFQLINGVTLKGGYAGLGEPDPNARDIDAYESILSGDLDGNDVEVADPHDLHDHPNRAENCYHVVTGSGTDSTAIVEGFTITAGNADAGPPHWYGGGMYNEGGSTTLANCTFSGNSAGQRGGGMWNWVSHPTLTNCMFSGNSSGHRGGGICNDDSNPMLTNCTFRGNSAEWDGGGICNNSSSPTLTNCMFYGNLTGEWGGGMKNYFESNPTLTNCTFSGNSAYSGGGMDNFRSSPTLTGCTFSENSAGWEGGGISSHSGSSPTLINCIFSGNSGGHWGGGVDNKWSSPTLTNCTFSGNSADFGGGMWNYTDSSPTLTNCTFSGNYAEKGGGMCNFSESSPTLTNCLFSGNWAQEEGGGMWNRESSPMVTNCTFSSNSAEYSDGMFNYWKCSPTLINCILWNGGDEIRNYDGSTVTINYSDVQGGWPGEGNIDDDPCFVDPGYWDPNGTPADANDDFWVDGDYHLQSEASRWDPNSESWVLDYVSSPCIDAGNPGCPMGDEPNDANNIRINMGAYGGTAEASKTPANWRNIADLTNDWTVDFNDLKVFVDYWLETGECIPSDLNHSQSVDFVDFAIFGQQWSDIFATKPGIGKD